VQQGAGHEVGVARSPLLEQLVLLVAGLLGKERHRNGTDEQQDQREDGDVDKGEPSADALEHYFASYYCRGSKV
jgi:hypothetical protein